VTAPVVMVLGTASSVGKSAIAAGLCRILRRRGARVAPFKAQNMSNNAAVTVDGLEIARSTAVQAAAAGIEPTEDMNPILLKPEADMRAQVIVRGRVWGQRSARDYFRRKQELWPIVAESLDRLRAGHEVVVAEGAGSPVELNLKAGDLVNMRVAAHAGAGCLLVGEIDRGGVFAQLIGTLDLLDPAERRLVKGTVVNRFRGDPELFADGVRILEERTGVPVFGVVPWVRDLGLAEEDGVALERPAEPTGAEVRVAVTRLPRIANFDEFAPLGRSPGVAVEYVDRPERLAGADLIVVPGTKATAADLAWLRERGLAEAIVAARAAGTPVVGVCGGYQMLGRAIHDPAGVESEPSSVPGLALLGHETTFVAEKRTVRVRGRVAAARGPLAAAAGADVVGYEIHAGRSAPGPEEPLLSLGSRDDGAISGDGLVLGTYLHGLFENEPVRRALVEWLRARRGLPRRDWVEEPDPHDRWADVLEASLDVPAMLRACGLGRWA
jgi:adenosylcobyric acid synthase